jgi:hypothetical protein
MAKKFIFRRDRHLAITPTFRMAFPSLFEAKAYRDPETGQEGKPEFKATMLFDSLESTKAELPPALKGKALPLAVAIHNAKIDFFGPDPKKWPKLDYPIFAKGDEQISKKTGEVFDGYAGKWVAAAKTGEKYPPKLLCANGDEPSEQTLYAGCFCRAVVSVKPYYFAKKNGVKLYLSQITKVRDGDRFGGFEEIQIDEDIIEESTEGDSQTEESWED